MLFLHMLHFLFQEISDLKDKTSVMEKDVRKSKELVFCKITYYAFSNVKLNIFY